MREGHLPVTYHVLEKRHITVAECTSVELAIELLDSAIGVRPRIEAVPYEVKILQLCFVPQRTIVDKAVRRTILSCEY